MGIIKYKTKQQELLLSCFKAMQGRHFTAEDVAAYFQKQNISIGIMGEECHKEVSHFHLKCEKCGTLIHLECHDLEQLSSHLMAEHGFALDPFRTVFYGLCENCRLAS